MTEERGQSLQEHVFAHLNDGCEQGLRDFIMEAPVHLVAQGLWEECVGFERLRNEELVPHILEWRRQHGTRPH